MRLGRAETDPAKRNLNEIINNMSKEERKKLDESVGKAFCKRAKAAKSGLDSAQMTVKACAKLNGGKTTESEGTFDSGCTFPLTTTQVVEDLDLKIEPLTEVSDIYQADGTALKLLGTVRMFLESDNLNRRGMIKCAVIEAGTSREILISIEYLKKWNLFHPTFPFESVDNYVDRKSKDNKYSALYTNLSNK